MAISLLNFSDERPARLLLSYFATQGIPATVQKRIRTDDSENQSHAEQNPLHEQDVPTEHNKLEDGNDSEAFVKHPPTVLYELSIENPADQERAISIAKAFLVNPNDPKYQQAAWSSGDTSTSSGSMFRGFEFESLTNWRKHLFTHVMGILIAIVYLFMYMGYSETIFNALNIQYYNELSQNNQWWRLLGPTFMHGGVAHLIMNLCWWWILASRLERTFGTSSLAILFVVSALVANVAQLMHTGPGFGGMSSVNYALFGFIAIIGWLRPSWGLNLPKGIIIFLVIWLLIGYSGILWVSTSDDLHLFGMLTGAVLALILHQATNLMTSKTDA